MAQPVINYSAQQPVGDPYQAMVMPAIQQGMEMAFKPQMAKQDLLKAQLANELAKVNVQYAVPMTEAELGYKEAQTSSLPYQALGTYYGGMGRFNQSQNQLNPNLQLIRVLNNPQFQELMGSNPDVAKAVTSTLANIGMGNTAGQGVAPPNMQMPGATRGPVPIDQIDLNRTGENGFALTPEQMQQLASAGIAKPAPGAATGNGMTQGGYQPTDQDVKNVQGAAKDIVIKKTTTAAQQNQRLYANTLDQILDVTTPLMPSVTKYAGLVGTYKGNWEKAQSLMGKESSQDFKNFQDFKNVYVPQGVNEIKRSLGGQATDQEQRILKVVGDPVVWDRSPEVALHNWNTLVKLYKERINPSLAQRPSEIQANLANSASRGTPAGVPPSDVLAPGSRQANANDPLGIR